MTSFITWQGSYSKTVIRSYWCNEIPNPADWLVNWLIDWQCDVLKIFLSRWFLVSHKCTLCDSQLTERWLVVARTVEVYTLIQQTAAFRIFVWITACTTLIALNYVFILSMTSDADSSSYSGKQTNWPCSRQGDTVPMATLTSLTQTRRRWSRRWSCCSRYTQWKILLSSHILYLQHDTTNNSKKLHVNSSFE